MGSWSEGCGVSGLEISWGQTCYIVMLRRHEFEADKWSIAIPPLRGEYDDYGAIDITGEDLVFAQRFGIGVGATDTYNFRPRKAYENPAPKYRDNRVYPFWISEVAYNGLGGLKKEWADAPGGTINDDWQKYIAHVLGRIPQEKEYIDNYLKLVAPEKKLETNFMEMVVDGLKRGIAGVFGLGTVIMDNIGELVAEEVVAERDYAWLIEAYRSCYVLHWGMLELRKTLAPQITPTGPQGAGEVALAQFYRMILQEAERRVAKAQQ